MRQWKDQRSAYEIQTLNTIISYLKLIHLAGGRASIFYPPLHLQKVYIDEMAHATKKSSLQFRLSLINKNTRINYLPFLGEKSNWSKPLSKRLGEERYGDVSSFAGQAVM